VTANSETAQLECRYTHRAVALEDLRVGMYLVDDLFDADGHLLMHGGIELIRPAQIALAQEASIRIVTIDVERGLGVDATSGDGSGVGGGPSVSSSAFNDEGEQVGFQEELPAATELMADAEAQAATVFEATRSGEKPDIDRVRSIARSVVDSVDRNSKAIPALSHLQSFDEYTFKHSISVCVLSVTIAKAAEFDDDTVLEIGTAGLLHDIGKMQVPRSLLSKCEELSYGDWQMLRGHPTQGARILKWSGGVSDDVLSAVWQHHERWDGSGYPKGLEGKRIHPYAQIISIADAYDAMVSPKAYRGPKLPFRAVHELFRCRASQFNEELTYHFIAQIGVYPIGSFVRTSQNELGIVSGHSAKASLHPRLAVVFDGERVMLRPGERAVNLDAEEPDAEGRKPRVTVAGDPALWGVSPKDFLLQI